jgi:hypothetical protein
MAKQKDITRVQDQILGQFKRDAKSSTDNSATAQAIARGRKAKQRLTEKAEQPQFSFRFLTTGK